ncbi:hypothetical protein HP532_20995 [Pseudomonas sp. CrR25]|nr:hypothetical protein [Pseudomonas sp. CrR25]
MKDRQPKPTAEVDEQQMLQHFREHQAGEPSAALDARILAAAAAQVRSPGQRPSAIVRLQAWLFGGRRVRWSLALGSVAVLGLGLGLSLRTFEQAPTGYDAPMPAAPALQRYAAPVPGATQKKAMSESFRLDEQPAGVAADAAAPMAEAAEAQAPTLGASSAARSKAEEAPLPDELRDALPHILRLREEGRQVDAAERLGALQRRYPQWDIEAELQRLGLAEERRR